METIRRFSISAVSAVTLLFALVVSVQAEGYGAKILSTTGTVEFQDTLTVGQWVSVDAEEVLPPGASLRTGPDSQAVLELDGSTVTLYETSLIRIPKAPSQVSTGSRPMRHPALDEGRALFDVTPTPDQVPYSVRTPSIVAGVKGTVFEVIASNGKPSVYVWRGLVEVTSLLNPENVRRVGAGLYTAMDHMQLSIPVEIPADRPEPRGLESHPASPNGVEHRSATLIPAADGKLPDQAKLDTLPANEHSMVSRWSNVEAPGTSGMDRRDVSKYWNHADNSVVQSAIDNAREQQSMVAAGALKVRSPKSLRQAGNASSRSGDAAEDANENARDALEANGLVSTDVIWPF